MAGLIDNITNSDKLKLELELSLAKVWFYEELKKYCSCFVHKHFNSNTSKENLCQRSILTLALSSRN